jgi:hypothetical protein
VGKRFVKAPGDLLLTSLEEAKEACEAQSLVLATKDQVTALMKVNGGSYTLKKCGYMADGKVGYPEGQSFKPCPDKPEAGKGYNAWCIEGRLVLLLNDAHNREPAL